MTTRTDRPSRSSSEDRLRTALYTAYFMLEKIERGGSYDIPTWRDRMAYLRGHLPGLWDNLDPRASGRLTCRIDPTLTQAEIDAA